MLGDGVNKTIGGDIAMKLSRPKLPSSDPIEYSLFTPYFLVSGEISLLIDYPLDPIFLIQYVYQGAGLTYTSQ